MLLSYNRLITLLDEGVLEGSSYDNVNGSSIDLRIGDIIKVECGPGKALQERQVLDITKKESPLFRDFDLSKDTFILNPGEFILAHSAETFNLPNNLSAEYKLKSSMARCGLEHLNAGWADPGWHGSKLTLELKNMLQYHSLLISRNMKIGQIVFFENEPVPEDKSYAVRGKYNNNDSVQSNLGVD